MEAMEEKARGCVDDHVVSRDALATIIHTAYQTGYRAAFGWTPVKDRLPDTERAVLVKDERTNAVWTSNMVDGRIVPLEATLIDIIEATHWREIEIPE
jgi:hypothetical protein